MAYELDETSGAPAPSADASGRHERSSALFSPGGRFRCVSSLGRGGMGCVWEVEDRERNGLRLALKELTRVTPAGILLFKEEFRALRDLRHPNLVELDELIECDGQWFLTMERIDGVSFDRYIAAGPTADIWSGARELSRSRVHRADGLHTSASASASAPASGARAVASPAFALGSVTSEREDGAQLFDEERLRAVLRQLAQGVAAMHRAGIVHRDLKPSNVMVDETGRVVILDFGVVADLGRGTQLADFTVGTVPYTSPEQAQGLSVTGASDWYSIGVLLFRSLTGGAVPFLGDAGEVLAHQLLGQVPRPEWFVKHLPRDLAELTMSLLDLQPARRPGPAAILTALGAQEPSAEDVRTSEEMPFVGRVEPLARLRLAAEDAAGGDGLRAVLVSGQSGVGKSATVRSFLRSLKASAGDRLLVLVGRCHERESLPYKAFDGVVDDIARTLIRERSSIEDLLGSAAASSLIRLFPSLGAAEHDGGARAKTSQPHGGDHVEARQRAFAALEALIAALATTRQVVISVDDLQWADPDSVALLRALTSHRLPCLLVMTARDTLQAEAVLSAVQCPIERVPLSGLSPDEARELASVLDANESSLDARALETIVRESAGHPMFIDELVRQREARWQGGRQGTSLDEAILTRVRAAQPETQALLRFVTIAGSPVPQGAVGAAAGFDAVACRRVLGELERARLVRLAGARHLDTVEPYHDRIREAIYGSLTPTERREGHGLLARALEASGAVGSDLLAHHFEFAGEGARAAEHALAAAKTAEQVFAFEQAACLYETAARLGDPSDVARAELLEARGRALQCAGNGREAADAYAAAAQCCAGVASIDLRRRSAEQLLMSGYVSRGKREAEQVLLALGDSLPRTHARAIARLGYSLLRAFLSRLRFVPHAAAECSQEELFRIDASWSVGAGLCMIDTVVGMQFALLGLRQSLPLGEPFRVARAATTTAVACSAMELGSLVRRAARLASEAASIDGSEPARFYAEIAIMTPAFLIDQQWTKAERAARSATEIWRRAGMGRGFEFDFATQFATWCLAMRGDVSTARDEVGVLVRDAQRTGNRFLEISLRSFHYQKYLADDDPERARCNAADAISQWQQADDPESFQLPHCWATLSLKSASLYEGRSEETPVEAQLWRKVRRSVLWVVGYVRDQVRSLSGRWELAAALSLSRAGQHSEARRRLRVSRSVARAIVQNPKPVTAAWGEVVLAGVDAAEGIDDRAVARLRRALAAFRATESHLHTAATSARLARMVGGDEGAKLAAEAARYFAAEKVRAPDRMTALVAPWPE